MSRLYIFVVALALFLTGCAQYTRDMVWENKIKPTPYEKPAHVVKPENWDDSAITYAWLGHATVLINFYGVKIITDPVLLDRIGPPEVFDNIFGIKRITQLPVEGENIPEVDVVLISHAHFDHLDLASLRKLNERDGPILVVPALTENLVADVAEDVIELDWNFRNEKNMFFEDLEISTFRVEHYGYTNWGGRYDKLGFNGYLISSTKNKKHIAFFGDTSYSRYRDEEGVIMKKPLSINWRDKFNPEILKAGIDLCIIPIGESYYYWNHISPEKTVVLAKELNCKKLLPIHYSTFILTPPENEKINPGKKLRHLLGHGSKFVNCQSASHKSVFPEIGVTCKLPE